MATVSFGGLGNGIDFGQVVTELVKIQRLPIDKLNEKKTVLQSKLADLGSLGAKLLAVQGAADALRLASSFDRTSATVSDEEVLSLSSSSTAVQGNYRVQVTQLATAHQITNKAAKAVASSTADIVAGTSAVVSFRVGTGAEQTVTLGDSGTLEDLRTAINDLGAGVTASIVNSGTAQAPAYRLVLTGTSTGAANTISITADGTALDLANTSGTGGGHASSRAGCDPRHRGSCPNAIDYPTEREHRHGCHPGRDAQPQAGDSRNGLGQRDRQPRYRNGEGQHQETGRCLQRRGEIHS